MVKTYFFLPDIPLPAGLTRTATTQYIVCDSEGELPGTGLGAGDLAYTKDTTKLWQWRNGAWGDTAGTGGGGAWGDITGTLSNQTDLQTALNAKAASGHNHDGTYAAASHNHAANEITSGTIATARLGSGTADSTTFLRGDQTWAAGGGGGEVNTGSNVGAGVQVFKDKSGVDLRFRTLVPENNQMVLTQGVDTISVAVRPPLVFSIGAYVNCANIGSTYDAINPSRGLGVMVCDLAGYYNSCFFYVHVNKVGTGTQSWQLWNDSDATQVGVIDDAGAAGVKFLSTTITGINLTGIKSFRVRGKSTTSTDDPHYFGAAVIFYRS